MSEEEETPNLLIDPTSSVKLTKNAKGEYQWEIKVYDKETDTILEKVKKLNDQLIKDYGTK